MYCFTDLFYRGDFHEVKGLGLRKWSRLLLRRRDFLGWASSKEFVVTAYNVCIRRSQMWGVVRYINTSPVWKEVQVDLHSLSPQDLIAAGLAANGCARIQQLLRNQGHRTEGEESPA